MRGAGALDGLVGAGLYTRGMDADRLTEELTDQDRVLLVFGYLGPLALVSLLATRREFVKWHAKQGVVLGATLILTYVVLHAVQAFLDRYLWALFGDVFRAAVVLTFLGAAVLLLFCIIRALEGERFKVPMLGDVADKL